MQSRQAGQPQAAQARGLGLMIATMRKPAFEHLLRRLSAAGHLRCCRPDTSRCANRKHAPTAGVSVSLLFVARDSNFNRRRNAASWGFLDFLSPTT
jgi:hypothetical protein